jgi:hypothetical protein
MGTNLILQATNKTFSEKKNQTCPLYGNPIAQKGPSSIPLFHIVSTFSNGLNGWCQCQSIHKNLPQIVSKPHTISRHFFSIATIANFPDLDGKHHTEVWPTHL